MMGKGTASVHHIQHGYYKITEMLQSETQTYISERYENDSMVYDTFMYYRNKLLVISECYVVMLNIISYFYTRT